MALEAERPGDLREVALAHCASRALRVLARLVETQRPARPPQLQALLVRACRLQRPSVPVFALDPVEVAELALASVLDVADAASRCDSAAKPADELPAPPEPPSAASLARRLRDLLSPLAPSAPYRRSLADEPGARARVLQRLRLAGPPGLRKLAADASGGCCLRASSRESALRDVARWALTHAYVEVPLSTSDVAGTLRKGGCLGEGKDGRLSYSLPAEASPLLMPQAAAKLCEAAQLSTPEQHTPEVRLHVPASRLRAVSAGLRNIREKTGVTLLHLHGQSCVIRDSPDATEPSGAYSSALAAVRSLIGEQVRVPESKIGHIIGPRGKTLKQIQERTGVAITMDGPVCILAGPPGATAVAAAAIHDIIQKGYTPLQFENFTEVELTVSDADVGGVVGNEREHLRRLQSELSQVVLRVRTTSGGRRRARIVVAGECGAVARAREALQELALHRCSGVTHPGQTFGELEEPSWDDLAAIGREHRHIECNFKVRVHLPSEGTCNPNVVIVGAPKGVARAVAYCEKLAAGYQELRQERARQRFWDQVAESLKGAERERAGSGAGGWPKAARRAHQCHRRAARAALEGGRRHLAALLDPRALAVDALVQRLGEVRWQAGNAPGFFSEPLWRPRKRERTEVALERVLTKTALIRRRQADDRLKSLRRSQCRAAKFGALVAADSAAVPAPGE